MFDSTPPNLPVEPLETPNAMPPSMGAAPLSPKPMPVVPSGVKGKKEPEDIFSGMDVAADQQAANAGIAEFEAAPRRSPILIGGIIFAVIAVVGIAGYVLWRFVLQPKASTPTVEVAVQPTPTPQPTPVQPQRIEQPPVIEQQPVVTPPPQPIVQPPAGIPVPIPQPVGQTAPETPATSAPVEGMDGDTDMLTDVEETLYATNASVADSDGDGYVDGAEVSSLFDPMSKGQSITKNTGILPVQWNGWSMLLLKPWKIGAGLQDPSIGSISTATLTQFSLQVKANTARQPLAAWLGSSSAQMKSFKTKNGLEAMQSADGLTTYLASGDTILIVTYELHGDPSFEYRTSYLMVVQSLRPPQP